MIKIANNLKALIKNAQDGGSGGFNFNIDWDSIKEKGKNLGSQVEDYYKKIKEDFLKKDPAAPTSFDPGNPHPYRGPFGSTWFPMHYTGQPGSSLTPAREDRLTIPGMSGITSLVKPDVFSETGMTTPRSQFENIYGKEQTAKLLQEAVEWQGANSEIQGPWTPVYADSLLDRNIPVYSSNSPVYNAAYIRNPSTNEEVFLQNNSNLDIYNTERQPQKDTMPDDFSELRRRMRLSEASATPLSEDEAKMYGFSFNPDGSINHSPYSLGRVTGVHEATHSLQPGLYGAFPGDGMILPESAEATGIPENERGAFNKVRNYIAGDTVWSNYSLRGRELPAHISEMKAQMFLNAGSLPDFKTPEGRQAFIDFWEKAVNDPNMSKELKGRYLPVINYLKSAHPRESENLLRAIVRGNAEGGVVA